MNGIALEFAKCRCGHRTPVRPSKCAVPEEDQTGKETETELVVIACEKCKRVYSFDSAQLEPDLSMYGLSPYHHQAPHHVFAIAIECDELDCTAQIPVIAVRMSTTTVEQLQEEKDTWRFVGLKCPLGHEYPDPPWEDGRESLFSVLSTQQR